jgi:hypothetical protein
LRARLEPPKLGNLSSSLSNRSQTILASFDLHLLEDLLLFSAELGFEFGKVAPVLRLGETLTPD